MHSRRKRLTDQAPGAAEWTTRSIPGRRVREGNLDFLVPVSVLQLEEGGRQQCSVGLNLMTLHWWRQAVHWKYSRLSRRNELLWPQPHAGQAKPDGQRDSISAASHLSSLP